jgi:hypothetical protein
MFLSGHSVPAQFQQGNSEIRLERPDFKGGRRALTLIEELLGQEKQVVLVQVGEGWLRLLEQISL